MRLGYHASHEQHSPGELLEYVRLAEQAGFDEAMCSDHIMPFSERQGHAGFAWSWLGAALQATSLPFGVVTTPGYRYHPAILAQAAATLADMFPGRFWLALGSGELLNEHVVGTDWPLKARRQQIVVETAEAMRRLFAGETVTVDGPVPIEEARLFVLPERPPMLIGAAISVETARWAGTWADGLITVAAPPQQLEKVIAAFREHGSGPLFVQAQLSFAGTEEDARQAAHDQWRVSTLTSDLLAQLRTPQQFDAATQTAREEDVVAKLRTSADPARHIEWLREYRELGFDAALVHNVHRDQRTFIRRFGDEVLPALRD